MGNYSLTGHALAIVAGATVADQQEIDDAIEYLENHVIGTEYYDGRGDELLKQIIAYLKKDL